MEIIEINIKNFGKLNNYQLNLTSNLNQIVEPNGFGKTTLMSFIKAMFYGFNKRNERQKFAPWNKGLFGGYIIFNHDGETYRLERTFGLRNALDEIRLFNTTTNQQLNIQNIGDHFLELDESTFTRLLYMDENLLNAQTTSVLIGKLTKLTQNQQTVISSFDVAMDILDAKRAYLFKQGNKGAIADKTTEIQNLKRELESANRSLEFSEKYAEEINNLKANEIEAKNKLATLEKQIDLATKQEANRQNQKQLTFLLNEKQNLENEQSKILSLFPLGFPTQDALDSYASKLNELNSLSALLKDQENQAQTSEECEMDSQTFNENKNKALELISSANNQKVQNKLTKPLITSLSFTAISLIALIISLATNSNIFSIVSGITLIFSILLGVIFYFKQPKTQSENQILNKINSLFPNQNFTSINNVLEVLNKIELSISIQNQTNEKIKDLKQNIARLENELNAFNQNFNLNANSFQQALDQIKITMLNFENLKQELNKTNQQIANFEHIVQTQNVADLDLNSLKNERTRYQNMLEKTKNAIIEFENKKIIEDNSADRIDQLTTSLNNAKITLDELTNELNAVKLAKEFLENAKTSLSSKYITPTQNALNELANSFENTKKYLPLHLKDDLTLLYEENNSLRDSSTLSTGLNHTFAILTRIALINTIFENNSMPLFLDDPFQSLDANNLKDMHELLNELSNSNQILYLTCSKERTI